MSEMLNRLQRLPLAAGILISMIGCSPAENASSSQAPAAVTAPATIENAPLAGGQAGLQQAIVAARQDLAGRRGKEVDSIQVLEADAVNWRSGAIGCPQPGVYYTQALVPGYRILLQAGSEVFIYHGTQGGAPFPCPPGRAETPAE
jgi:hypothetical protein